MRLWYMPLMMRTNSCFTWSICRNVMGASSSWPAFSLVRTIWLITSSIFCGVRSSSTQKIEEVINHIVRTKLNAGQLDEAPMTLQQLEQVKQEFVRIITGMYHNRIDYPESSGGITATWQPTARQS